MKNKKTSVFTGMQILFQTFYASGNRMLPPFVEIMQSVILIQNIKKKDWIVDGNIFVVLFVQCMILP